MARSTQASSWATSRQVRIRARCSSVRSTPRSSRIRSNTLASPLASPLAQPLSTAVELLATVCQELRIDVPPGTTSSKVLVDALSRRLLEAHARGRRTVIIIDEAQNLSMEALEEVRLLTNLETSERKLLDPDDLEEALRAANAIGDDRLQKDAGHTVNPETFTHGTSEQRMRWFKRGFESGRLDACDTLSGGSL